MVNGERMIVAVTIVGETYIRKKLRSGGNYILTIRIVIILKQLSTVTATVVTRGLQGDSS